MPRTKLQEAVRQRKRKTGDELAVMIFGSMAVRGITYEAMAANTGISPSRLCRRRTRPEDLTVGELLALCRALELPIEALRQCIHY